MNVTNYFNFFTNKIINIRKKRIINLCCHIFSNDKFHLKTIAKFIDKMNIVIQIDWVIRECEKITNYQFNRVNCIFIDICTIMKFIWFHIKQHSKIKYVFFVFCDSYELQFFLKNILKFFFFEHCTKRPINY